MNDEELEEILSALDRLKDNYASLFKDAIKAEQDKQALLGVLEKIRERTGNIDLPEHANLGLHRLADEAIKQYKDD